MKRFLLSATCTLALCLPVFSQGDDAEFVKWMKDTGAASGSLRKNLAAKDGAAASADAKKLQAIFVNVHDFWLKKKIDNATKFSSDAVNGYKEVAELSEAGKFEDAQVAMKKTMATCGGCHESYREKSADGTYKIKY